VLKDAAETWVLKTRRSYASKAGRVLRLGYQAGCSVCAEKNAKIVSRIDMAALIEEIKRNCC
jgi:hypothetical protein